MERIVKNGRIKQSVSRWCFGKIPLEEFCGVCRTMGLAGIDLLDAADFATLKKHGLVCTMTNSHGIGKGLNRKENHAECLAAVRTAIETTADAGFPNAICFSGNRAGMDDEEGAKNCIEALKQIAPLAEREKVTVCMELLNSSVDHKDYMCDRPAWGAKVCRAVGSERVKLLYDIYHVAVQEGVDGIAQSIRQFKDCIGHIHTGGVPGRNEIDETQKLNYAELMKVLLEVKYAGYVAHEFIPRRDPLTSLARAVTTCNV